MNPQKWASNKNILLIMYFIFSVVKPVWTLMIFWPIRTSESQSKKRVKSSGIYYEAVCLWFFKKYFFFPQPLCIVFGVMQFARIRIKSITRASLCLLWLLYGIHRHYHEMRKKRGFICILEVNTCDHIVCRCCDSIVKQWFLWWWIEWRARFTFKIVSLGI